MKSIEHYEEFLKNPIYPEIGRYNPFPIWSIHSKLSTLYEREYQFETAIFWLKQCIYDSCGSNPADFTRIGDILIKKDGIRKGVEFFRELKNSSFYEQHKYTFDYALNDAIEKEKRGYVYRPRPKIK